MVIGPYMTDNCWLVMCEHAPGAFRHLPLPISSEIVDDDDVVSCFLSGKFSITVIIFLHLRRLHTEYIDDQNP